MFQYKDFLPYFKGELFNANEWAQLFKRAGAQYVILVTKHHDGYCLWDSKYQPEWNSVMSGPKRNVVAEVTHAVRAAGMKMVWKVQWVYVITQAVTRNWRVLG